MVWSSKRSWVSGRTFTFVTQTSSLRCSGTRGVILSGNLCPPGWNTERSLTTITASLRRKYALSWISLHNTGNAARLREFSSAILNVVILSIKDYAQITVTSEWTRWRLKSRASPLFTQPFIQAQLKENIKSPRHWPLCGEFTGNRLIPHTNGH